MVGRSGVLAFTKSATGYLPPAPPSDPGWAYTSYTYGDAAHKHAVTSLTSGETYQYDANGNMTQRVEGGATYTQVFDAENRLVSVTVNSQTTTFVFDGDGNLVKKVKPDGTSTIYIGSIYEVDLNASGGVTKTTKYYPAAGAVRVLQGDGSTLYYVLKDHLGSASAVTDSTGNVTSEQRYYPYGETRLTSGALPTDRLFTGQREIMGLGIYHFGARFYSPTLARFVSADSVVPEPGNPQALNRYSYAYGNPLKYVDPTGHAGCYNTGVEIGSGISQADCWAYGRDKWIVGLPVDAPKAGEGYSTARAIAKMIAGAGFGSGYATQVSVSQDVYRAFSNMIEFSSEFSYSARVNAIAGAYRVALALAGAVGAVFRATAEEMFGLVFGKLRVQYDEGMATNLCQGGAGQITCGSDALTGMTPNWFAHELGHVFAGEAGFVPYNDLAGADIRDNTGIQIAGACTSGLYCKGGYWFTANGYLGRKDPWVNNRTGYPNPVNEDFANMFNNWAYDSFNYGASAYGAGTARHAWMASYMSRWILLIVNPNGR